MIGKTSVATRPLNSVLMVKEKGEIRTSPLPSMTPPLAVFAEREKLSLAFSGSKIFGFQRNIGIGGLLFAFSPEIKVI